MSDLLLGSQRVSPARAVAAGFSFNFTTIYQALRDLTKDVELARGPYCEEWSHRVWVPAEERTVFAYVTSPKATEELVPPSWGLSLLRQSTVRPAEGSTLDFRLRVLGLPLRGRNLILAWKEGRHATYTLQRGLFPFWQRELSVEKLGDGSLMKERILYRPPLGWFGSLVAWFFLRPRLQGAGAYRRRRLIQFFLQKPVPESVSSKRRARG
jgi:ligand-binding SRPBCC domain-containing protein